MSIATQKTQEASPVFGIRKSAERGKSSAEWLQSWHSFSFADYHDIRHMGFGHLRVINDDVIAPGAGFGMHGHRDMEIITVVLSGALKHQDSLGHGTVILPGEIQRMTAGAGIMHGEFNASETEPVRLLQIWIYPETRGLAPSYAQERIPDGAMHNRFALIAANEGGVISMQQNLKLYRAQLDAGVSARFTAPAGKSLWLQMAEGDVIARGGDAADAAAPAQRLLTGDALYTPASKAAETLHTVTINLQAQTNSDVLIFEQDV